MSVANGGRRVAIVAGCRTPFCRAGTALKDIPAADLAKSAAVELVRDGRFGCMVALRPPEVLAVPLQEAVAKLKLVPPNGDLVRTARSIGVSFGDA